MVTITWSGWSPTAQSSPPGSATAPGSLARSFHNALLVEATGIEPLDAARILEKHKYGCLPVVSSGKLVGILTEADFLRFARVYLELEQSAS